MRGAFFLFSTVSMFLKKGLPKLRNFFDNRYFIRLVLVFNIISLRFVKY